MRLAGGYRVTSCTTPEASPLASSLLPSPYPLRRLLPWPCAVPTARRLRHQLRSWLRRLRRGYPASSLRSTAHRRAGVNRKRLNITAHYPKYASRCAGLRLVAYRWRALRVRVMVGYVLRPSPDKGHVCSLRSAWLFWRCAWVVWVASAPRARALAGFAGGQLVSRQKPSHIERKCLHGAYTATWKAQMPLRIMA